MSASTAAGALIEPTGTDPDISLAEFLHARARASAVRRLALDAIGGGVIAGVAAWARPVGWSITASAASCFAMYGVWAIAERHVDGSRRDAPAYTEFAWFVLRSGAALLGVAACLLLVMALLGVALGTWIS